MNRILDIGYVLKLSGKEFVIQKIVGKGASSVTYLAEHNKTEHILKECNPLGISMHRNEDGVLVADTKLGEEKFFDCLSRFKAGAENQLLFRLTDDLKNVTSNIQDIHDANGTLYIDMTYFCGDTYDNVTDKTLYDLFRRMKALARVVGHYHESGYLHLDIKPQNIYAIPETPEMVMMFDFDSVVQKNDADALISSSYTDVWAAPEQKMQKYRNQICVATDLFAIGEIIFYKLFGRHSAEEDRLSFSQYEYVSENKLFENVNPKVFTSITEFFHKTLSCSVKKRYQSADELIEKLDEIIVASDPIKQQLLTTCPPAKKCFVGRDKELAEIHSLLKNQKMLFLSGLGGIGKSELAKAYALTHAADYDEVIFATYKGSIMLLINDDSAVHISNFCRSDNSTQTEYYKSKLGKLMDLCTERTLFIIDNVNSLEFGEDDKVRWTELLKLRCKFLFTTRLQISSYPSIQITEIADHEDKLKLFNEWCEIEDEVQMDAASKIIELVNGHTFTIELIAKQTCSGFLSPVEKLNTLINKGINKSGSEIIEADKDLTISQGRVIDHICMLFDIAELDDAKQLVLNNISLVPPSGLDAKLFANICAWGDDVADTESHVLDITLDDGTILTPDRVKAEIVWLTNNGWICRNGSIVCVHPIVTEAVWAKLDVLVPCIPYMFGITACIKKWESYPKHMKMQLLDCAQVLISIFIRFADATEDIAAIARLIGQFYCKTQFMLGEALVAFQLAEKKFMESRSDDNELQVSIKNGIAVVYDNMANISGDSNQRNFAIAAHKECLSIYESFNADPINVAITWQNLACAYDNNKMYDSAKVAFDEAIKIMHEVMQNQGNTVRNVSEITTIYTNYAAHYKKIKCYEDALTNLNTAFGYASLLDNKNELVAKICHDIAATILLMDGGDLNRAINHVKRSLEIRNEILLPDSYYLAMSKYVLARCYIRTGDIQQAKVLLEEAKSVFIKTLGAEHKDTAQLVRTLASLEANTKREEFHEI